MGRGSKVVMILIFSVGFQVMLYPLFSRTYYDYRGNEEITSYRAGLAEKPSEEVQAQIQSAHAYNNALLSGEMAPLSDPYSEEEKEEGITEYAHFLEVREKLGVLTIPKINMKFPVFAGMSERVLQNGVGHMAGTSLPVGGLNTNSILTAHRGLTENKLFTDLDKMSYGDLFFMETIAGKLAYKVVDIKIIEPTEIEALKIEQNRDLITLLTCTPYMVNTHRLLVIGERAELPAEEIKELVSINKWQQLWPIVKDYIWILIPLFVAVLYFVRRGWTQRRRGDKDE